MIDSANPSIVSHLNRARTSGECLCERSIKERKVLVSKGQKKGFTPRVTSYGQPMALIPPEASPHKRRHKCVTNISPRRLMTHLLHQMVHYRTTLRGSEQRSATIAGITIHTHATILNIKRGSSEYCAMRCLLRVTLIHRQGWVQDGTLLNVLWNEVGVFLCKN